MKGSIFFVAGSESFDSDLRDLEKLAAWTMQWQIKNGNDFEFFTYANISSAIRGLNNSIAIWDAPLAVVILHGGLPRETLEFAGNVRSRMPESWVVEWIDCDTSQPTEEKRDLIYRLRKPVEQNEWIKALNYMFFSVGIPLQKYV